MAREEGGSVVVGVNTDHVDEERIPLPQVIDQFYTTDVFMHTWDLARATDAEVLTLTDGFRLGDSLGAAVASLGTRLGARDAAPDPLPARDGAYILFHQRLH